MIKLLRHLSSRLVVSPTEFAESLTRFERYRRFRTTILLVMITTSIIPLGVLYGISMDQYRGLLKKEEQSHLRWHKESAKKSIEAFIQELQRIVNLVADEYGYETLQDQGNLSRIFSRIKQRYTGLVDLGVISGEGIQQAYAGPYNLQGKNYHATEWYPRAVVRRTYISEIFLGYRKVPHFVVAVSRKVPGKEEYWVLRASIDADTLEKFITTINTEASDDFFIIDAEGVLQTRSRYYGKVTEEYPFNYLVKPNKSGVTMIEGPGGDNVVHCVASLEDTPWKVVLVKRGYIHSANWLSFNHQLLLIVVTSVILVLIVIIQTTSILAKRIRAGDERREEIVSEVEHAAKLASIGRLAAGVAHEINNPLEIINQKAGLMSDLLETAGEFSYRNKFEISIAGIQKAVDRCKVITHRLLGFARRMDVSLEFILINDLLEEVLSFLAKEALYHRIEIKLAFTDNLPRIHSDRGQLQQVFLNIINNSIDAVGQDGSILISTLLKDEHSIQVQISDSGPGIPPEVMQHIFEPFFTTKPAGKGTGLGLSISYGIVKKLGGEITVKSKAGEGTTFSVNLPIVHIQPTIESSIEGLE